MYTAGIIAEYNPLHNGHLHHIAETRRAGATHIVAVLSGNFVQRAEPACMDKFTRARLACAAGADLVVELPLVWATGVSERFALGGVRLLGAMGCVDALSFGSECADIGALRMAARAVEDPRTVERTARLCEAGLAYPAARARAVRELFGQQAAAPLGRPNDLLAVDYLKAIDRTGCALRPLVIPRAGTAHDAQQPCGGFASAGCLRARLRASGKAEDAALAAVAPYLPPYTLDALRCALAAGRLSGGLEALEQLILYALRTTGADALERVPGCAAGLGRRLFAAAGESAGLDELFARAKTRRYTMSRVRRAALHAVLGVREPVYANDPPYLRILAIGAGGAALLRQIKRRGTLPVSHSLARLEARGGACARTAQLEAAAGELYAMSLPNPPPRGAEYTNRLFRTDSSTSKEHP